MKAYKDWAPSAFDTRGLFLPDRQDWLVLPMGRNRDSNVLDEINFDVALEMLGGESADVFLACFNHWACGWFEIILVRPDTDAANKAKDIESQLEDYPILDDDKYTEVAQERANEMWTGCFTDAERLEYIRRKRRDFEFRNFADLLGCVRGRYFAGDAVSLLCE